MTDKRDLEDRVADLRDRLGGNEEILVARRDLATGEVTDLDGNPVDLDNHGADTLLILEESIVMERERAEKEGHEIIGPYEDGPDGRDLVETPADRIGSDDLRDGVTSR